jgi:hypothetical protein
MRQEAKFPEQAYRVKLPENYYSKTDYSYWYGYRLIDQSISGEGTPTERFIDSVYKQLPIKAPNHLSHRKKKALNNIICNLLTAYRYNRMLNISRDKAKYSIPRQYGLDYCTYTFIVINGIDALEKAGYIYQEKGHYDIESETGQITKICATEKLINEYYSFSNLTDENFRLLRNRATGAYIIYSESRFNKISFATPIQLKDENKKLIRYLPLRKIRRMRDNLNEYNSLLSNVLVITPHTHTTTPDHHTLPIIRHFADNYSIDKELNEVTFYRVLETYLYRVFNNRDFKQGGRFYGAGYQGLSGNDRKLILINEYPVVECDYKAIHPRMCYHLLKIEYKEDPYSAVCDKDELREPTKKLMNMMINVDSDLRAIMAFKKWIKEEEGMRDIVERNDLDERKLMQKIFDAHKTISKFFNSGKGVELQYLDSCIAEVVLMHFTKQGIACLCVHDSFIVEERYKNELGEVMKEEYKKLIGFRCKIKFNK